MFGRFAVASAGNPRFSMGEGSRGWRGSVS
jgi:hypothetical protein